MSRSTSLVAAFAVAALTLVPSLADARAGGGFSFGSRGTRTYSAPPSTNTAPFAAAPMDRSMTPRTAPSYGGAPMGSPMPARSGFASGLLGGLLGAGIGGMLFGHGMFGGGGFGFIGFILQLAIMFFIARWLFRTFFRRPAMAGMGMGSFARMGQPAPGMMGGGGGAAPRANPVAIGPGDYQEFERTLQEVQAAWSAQDLRHLQSIASPEMVSYFSEQLSEQSSRGVRNTVTDVRLDKGDLSEAWSEGGREYATVAMRFSMVDVTRDSSGRVVDGNPAERSSATELWTFVRAPGGRWLLSAIQQGR
jgi:predicted lipid-binding transport protein (Tim44 family)